MESHRIIMWRIEYLEKIYNFRNEEMQIYYLQYMFQVSYWHLNVDLN